MGESLAEKSRLWVGSVVIDCDDFQAMMAFWKEALHYVPKYPPEEGWVILTDPEKRGPNISLNLSSEGHLKDYRLHLDLYATDPEREVERLLHIGAKLVRPAQEGKDFITLADPDDNLFDVIDKKGLPYGER